MIKQFLNIFYAKFFNCKLLLKIKRLIMKTTLSALIFILVFSASALKAQKLEKVWESSSEVLKTPESVLYDNDRDVIFVSNINGAPDEKDGNGFISILNPDGKLKTKNWVEGLNAPKGMAIFNNKLYVADIDNLVVIDIEKEKVVENYNAPNAVFLNDVAACKNGMIFVTDTRTNKVHVLKDDNFSVWLEDGHFNSPNGLMTENGKLYVGARNIYEVDIKTKKVSKIIEDAEGVDGLEKNNNGEFVFSNWPGRIWIHKNGKNIKLLDTTEQELKTADIDFALKYDWILVPTFYDNRVVAYKIVD